MKLGISSSCFFPLETEKAVKLLVENKIPNIEIFINAPSEITPRFLDILKEILKNGETEVVAVHPHSSALEPYNVFTKYERRFYDAVEDYKRYAEFSRKLGAKIIPFHGDLKKRNILSDEEYIEKFGILKAAAAEEGAILAQENVNLFRSSELGFLQKMKDAIPDVAFVCDIKQIKRAGTDIFETIEVMGENLKHFHISDSTPQSDCLLPFDGETDFDTVFEKLAQTGYNGAVMIEVYKDAYKNTGEVLDSCRLLEKTLKRRKK